MSDPDWLTDCLEECVALVTATLYRVGGSAQRAADQAEEAVSHACEQAVEKSPMWETPTHCRNRVVRVALNYATQTWRSERRHRDILQKIHADGRTEREAQEPSAQTSPVDLVREALESLSEGDRRLIVRRFLEGLTLEELAEEFALGSVTTAWKRCQSALEHLRTILIAQHDAAADRPSAPQPARSPPHQP